jgi:glycosyltransferase involved in cell wall biosynthesis
MKKVSVIMASYLGDYEGCADNRDDKFIRAINSFLGNDYRNSELIVIGDCCKKTESILKEIYSKELLTQKIKFYNFPKKQELFSGTLRSKGIEYASGDFICYLDTDDMIGENHISSIAEQMDAENLDWCYYNDFFNVEEGLVTKEVSVSHGSIGTSSIAHKNVKGLTWHNCDGYGHDYQFVRKLEVWSDNYSKIFGCTYIICHIPKLLDK